MDGGVDAGVGVFVSVRTCYIHPSTPVNLCVSMRVRTIVIYRCCCNTPPRSSLVGGQFQSPVFWALDSNALTMPVALTIDRPCVDPIDEAREVSVAL